MAKTASDRRLSAAEQHRKASAARLAALGRRVLTSLDVAQQAAGAFDKAQTERLHTRVSSGRTPFATRKLQHQSRADSAKRGRENDSTANRMGAASSLGVLVALCGSLFVVCYAVVLTAMVKSP